VKILQITHRYAPDIGGIETHVQAISEQFVAQGHSVTVVAMSPGMRAAVETEENGVRIVRLPSIGFGPNYQFPIGLLRFIRRHAEDFDVVHAHNYHASPLLLAALARPPTLVVTPHLNDRPHSRLAEYLHRPYKLLGRWALHRADAIVCVSNAERSHIQVDFGIASQKIHVVPNGVNPDAAMHPSARDAREPALILYVGRLEAYKRVQRLIRSIAILPEPFHLVIVGDGPYRKTLQRQMSALRVERRVQFLGRISDDELRSLYRRAGVVANVSSAEAFGLTVLEAVARGCPVVCSDIPAFRELAVRFPHHITLQSDLGPQSLGGSIQTAADVPSLLPPDMISFTWQSVCGQLSRIYSDSVSHPEATLEIDGLSGEPSI
jgi:glycosyltransferase involved in cell wall biosynthesis